MPFCAGCEQKIPYQELDTHQRYCRKRSGDESPSTAQRLTTREAMFDECLELMEVRLADEELRATVDGEALPRALAGIEGSNIRYSRPVDDR